MNSLAQQIEALQTQLASQLPADITTAFEESIVAVKSLGLEEKSLQVGDQFPDFNLINSNSQAISLPELLSNGQVIIAFFRGTWCPYCNLELKALQESIDALSANACSLVAISPQASTYNADLKEAQQLDFELLQDKDNELAKAVGISFSLSDELSTKYRNLGIDLAQFNNNNAQELPVPAVYLVGQDQVIKYRYIDSNYMHRVNLEELKKAVCQP